MPERTELHDQAAIKRTTRGPGVFESDQVAVSSDVAVLALKTDAADTFIKNPNATLWLAFFSSIDGGRTWLFEVSHVVIGDAARNEQSHLVQAITLSHIMARHGVDVTPNDVRAKVIATLVNCESVELGLKLIAF
jgi:hypothetical protein